MTKQVKRYEASYYEPYESADGDYVRYDDIKHLLHDEPAPALPEGFTRYVDAAMSADPANYRRASEPSAVPALTCPDCGCDSFECDRCANSISSEELLKQLNRQAESTRASDIERMVKALGKLYRMGARGVKDFPEKFPIGKVKEIAEEGLGDRLEEQKQSAPSENRTGES